MKNECLGIAVIGLGGAVGTTMVAGIELLRKGMIDTTGLPLAEIDAGLAAYDRIRFGGWDLFGEPLSKAAEEHDVLTYKQFVAIADELAAIRPWPAAANARFLANIDGTNTVAGSHRDAIGAIRRDIRRFREECGRAVVINLASTERLFDESDPQLATLDAFEAALDAGSPSISPAMLYSYASIAEGVPYGNFTPSAAADVPALIEFATKSKVPIAGKDGKTGQTMIKSVLAPAFKTRALKVEGWFSTNILGNRDGLALADEGSLASKVKTKSSLLDDILGYEVEDHIVDIRYYKPRGDNKEAWDNVDLVGFMGRQMQLKVNFLCRDSILAAPLAIEIARCLDLARARGEGGIQKQLSVFFKMPMTGGERPENALFKQEEMLENWLNS